MDKILVTLYGSTIIAKQADGHADTESRSETNSPHGVVIAVGALRLAD